MLLALVLGATTCAPLERAGPVAPVGFPATTMPRVRVALAVGDAGATVGGGAALLLTQPDGTPIGRLPPGASATVRGSAAGILVTGPGVELPPLEAASLIPEDTGFVRVNDREYRGVVDLVRTSSGLAVVNHVAVEDYLGGVVNAEMGRRAPGEMEALRAQAVLSRTVALRAIGRQPARGFDLVATIADQAYAGVAGELVQGLEAVTDTRGMVLTWMGQPIDAFFHSTCGGQTAEPTEVFAGAGGRPYLRSVPDRAPDGAAWCAGSPRFRWREQWTGAELLATLRETLPAGVASSVGRVDEVAITSRSATGRVLGIAIHYPGGVQSVTGSNTVRQVLRPLAGGLLRSGQFTLHATREGGAITRLGAEGSGAGHAVGMCQWGAVGRARGGQRWQEILGAYFPGGDLTRLY